MFLSIEEKFDSLPNQMLLAYLASYQLWRVVQNTVLFIVPYTRGDEVSRKPEQIFDEVARLVEQGFGNCFCGAKR